MVKKRRPGLGIGLWYSPSGVTWAKRSRSASRGNAHGVEPDPPVVDPVQPFLRPAILDAHAGEDPAALVPDGDQEGVNAVVVEDGGRGVVGMVVWLPRGVLTTARNAQPGEYGGHAPVQRGVADVVLARVLVRGGDHELGRRGVVGGGRAEVADIGAVPGLGHRVAAGKFQRGDPRQVEAVVLLRPKLRDAAAKRPNCTPYLTSTLRSPSASSSKTATAPQGSPSSTVVARIGHRAQPGSGQRPHRGERAFPVPHLAKSRPECATRGVRARHGHGP